MLPMRSMVLSKSKPWKVCSWKCFLFFESRNISGWFSRRCSPRGDEEARRSARGIAYDVAGHRLRHLDHEPDDVARRPELAVLPRRRDLPEHVFVEVALRVAVRHRDGVEEVHDLREERRLGDREARVFHVVGVRRVVAAEGAQEREDVPVHERVHRARLEVLEPRPAHLLVTDAALVFLLRENPPLERLARRPRLVLRERLEVVEPAQEEEVRDLLDHLERVRDPA